MGPFVNSQRFEYILLAVDYVSRWVEAVAMRKANSKIVQKFLTDLISRFGHPKILISDGGSNLVNSLIRNFMQKNRIEHQVSTPYHPQTNGLAEVSNREIKSIIQKIVRPNSYFTVNGQQLKPCVEPWPNACTKISPTF